jgi:glycosyltransferase involved in cell wall biosynthesis
LREIRPDVVHTHQIGPLFYAGWAARAERIPLVVHTEHGKHYAQRARTRWLGWLAARHARRFFCVSEDVARGVRDHRVAPAAKVCVVANGIDTERFRMTGDAGAVRRALGIPADVPVIGTLGRLAEVKRQDLLIRAFARVRERFPDARLVLVGDGPLLGELRALSEGLGVLESVHFTGYQADPRPYLAALDVFALTSRSEGMPLAVLEAWATGVPVVASAVGGLPALIDPGRTGLLFPSGDESALTAALTGLLADPRLRHRLSDEGSREVRDRYDVRHMAAEYERHYRELIGERAPLLQRAM